MVDDFALNFTLELLLQHFYFGLLLAGFLGLIDAGQRGSSGVITATPGGTWRRPQDGPGAPVSHKRHCPAVAVNLAIVRHPPDVSVGLSRLFPRSD